MGRGITMITEMYRFSDDEIILKMKYSDLLNLGGEIYYLMGMITKDEKNYPKCKEILEVIKDGKEKT